MTTVAKFRGGFRTAAISKMEPSVIIVKDWKPLTIIRKSSILDAAAVLNPPLKLSYYTGVDVSIDCADKVISTHIQSK